MKGCIAVFVLLGICLDHGAVFGAWFYLNPVFVGVKHFLSGFFLITETGDYFVGH